MFRSKRVTFSTHAKIAWLGCLVTLALLCACERASEQAPSVPSGPSDSVDSAAARLAPYPRATWRLAREQLPDVLLRVSHIAIRHRDSLPEQSRLRTPDWLPDAPSERSRQEAIALADSLAAELSARPDRFEELARRRSDDAVSAPWGGALGVVPASMLPEAFLDAVAALEPGQISKPFETDYGVHLLRLEETPPAQQLAGRRILIAYRDSGLAIAREGRTKDRTHAEAMALARRVVREAGKPGADFGELVQRYSDSPDVAQDGDIGVWSTHEPMIRSLVLEALSRVEVGEVTGPVDSLEGIQILQRTQVAPRPRFAAEYIVVGRLGEQTDDERRRKMAEIVGEVQQDPRAFDRYRQSLCCREPWAWSSGRGLGPQIEQRLRSLSMGEIDSSPVETYAGLYLLRRIQPPLELGREPRTRLPAPERPDLQALVRSAGGPVFANLLKLLTQHVSSVPIAHSRRQALDDLFVSTASAISRAPEDERARLLSRFWSDARNLLSPAEFELLHDAVFEYVTGYLMGG